jgi:hypothetical protein
MTGEFDKHYKVEKGLDNIWPPCRTMRKVVPHTWIMAAGWERARLSIPHLGFNFANLLQRKWEDCSRRNSLVLV